MGRITTRGSRRFSHFRQSRMAGEFFGEGALLSGHQPCNATVTAVTPCTLYKLHRGDLEVAMALQPAIRKALEEESRKRMAMHYAG